MYKILFIDELAEDTRRFQRYVASKDSEKKFEVIILEPEEDLESFVEYILTLNIDALVSDFMLAEYMPNIPYNGVELVEKILQRKQGFPCFVLTSFDDSAVKESFDVNIVYIKALMQDEKNEKITFIERVETQIQHYQKRIEDFSKNLQQLVKKSELTTLTAAEEETLLKLDKFLEEAIDRPLSMPSKLKSNNNLKKLYKLIDNTDELIESIKKKSK